MWINVLYQTNTRTETWSILRFSFSTTIQLPGERELPVTASQEAEQSRRGGNSNSLRLGSEEWHIQIDFVVAQR